MSVSNIVENLICDTVNNMGLSLWDVKYVKEGAGWYLRIFIDKEGGVSIDDCSEISRLIDPILEEHDPISESYYLEVCSPGLNRTLTKKEHFLAMIGHDVCIQLYKAIEGNRKFEGKLISYVDDIVTIDNLTFAKVDIAKAYLNEIK